MSACALQWKLYRAQPPRRLLIWWTWHGTWIFNDCSLEICWVRARRNNGPDAMLTSSRHRSNHPSLLVHFPTRWVCIFLLDVFVVPDGQTSEIIRRWARQFGSFVGWILFVIRFWCLFVYIQIITWIIEIIIRVLSSVVNICNKHNYFRSVRDEPECNVDKIWEAMRVIRSVHFHNENTISHIRRQFPTSMEWMVE